MKTQWKEGTKAAEKLKDEQTFLTHTRRIMRDIKTLEKQLSL